ncbi:MAG: competence/damage-inducible protein A [Lachnospiraceae bacterium]|nr:competence/damage-inducible protein A [Lachnospiraceae bacterium]
MTVELISVGTELLLGNIVNTNAAFLAEQCAALGLSCYYQTVVGDNEERLLDTIKTAMGRADVLILSGGLGPTPDDLTKETAAKAFGMKLVEDAHSKELIRSYFEMRGKEIVDSNWKQALIPEGAIVLDNANGTAPGVIMEGKDCTAVLLPGPPNELVPMFKNQVVPYLNSKTKRVIYSQTVKICGMGESMVAEKIQDLIDAQENPTIATYAKTGEVHVRITASAEDEKKARKLVKPMRSELKERFKDYIYTTDEDTTLEKSCVDLLVANGLTISTMESCTGGLIAGRLINVPGVSDVFKAGYVTYSNKAKRKVLGVKQTTLKKYGAVSTQVAKEMAEGVSLLTKADVTISVTGIAGPDGGSEEKPVGLVYIGCRVKNKTRVEEYRFSGNRAKIRENAVVAALTLLRKCVLEYYSQVTFKQ